MAVKQLARAEKERALLARRELKIRRSKHDFWEYCKTDSPDFYKEGSWHLKLFSWILQALHERRLTKREYQKAAMEICPAWFLETSSYLDNLQALEDAKIYKSLIINMPPRHGKSRTLVLFCQWALGKDPTEKIITCSYNDDQATEFSRFTRDGISKEKAEPHEIVYSDIFPGIQIARGNASYMKWALEGHFFNYKGAGVGGSITGKGATIAIVDDPIKDAETALNETALQKIWNWYSGTFLSRKEEGAIEIVNHTRWSKHDICGRVLNKPNASKWFTVHMEAFYEGPNEMLCPEMLSLESYEDLKINILPEIFEANYHQRPIDAKGRLYKKFLTWQDLPRDSAGNLAFDEIISYTDTADRGKDYLATFIAGLYRGQAFILDVLYTKEPMEVTEPALAAALVDNKVNRAWIESNNGGRGYARAVENILWDQYKNRNISVEWFHQSGNKEARILANSHFVQKNIFMPWNYKERWPELTDALESYQKEGKNKNDDAPDALTGLAEKMQEGTGVFLERV
jgi:predicted phage terminase large subunit-like protein